jgi:hypothetical protein
MNQGLVLQDLGDYEEARQTYERALAIFLAQLIPNQIILHPSSVSVRPHHPLAIWFMIVGRNCLILLSGMKPGAQQRSKQGLTGIPIDDSLLFKCFATNSLSVKRTLAKQ